MTKEERMYDCKLLKEVKPIRIWGTIPKTKEPPSFFIKDWKFCMAPSNEQKKASTRKKK